MCIRDRVHTDHRIGRINDLSFIDLPSNEPGTVRLSIYEHGHEEFPVGPYQFTIAGTTGLPDLTLSNQDTLIELVLYDRVLSDFERNKVSSHLAIKYGLTLYETSYLSTDGTKIWDHTKNRDYASNIIGVGRDDSSGLLQRQSTSANEPGFILIAVDTVAIWNHMNNALVHNEHFLLLGDDNAQRKWSVRQPGQPQYLSLIHI